MSTSDPRGVFATLESNVADDEATVDVRAYHYTDLDDDAEMTVSLSDLQVTIGMSPEDLADLGDRIDDVLAELEGAGDSYTRGRGDMESTPGGGE